MRCHFFSKMTSAPNAESEFPLAGCKSLDALQQPQRHVVSAHSRADNDALQRGAGHLTPKTILVLAKHILIENRF